MPSFVHNVKIINTARSSTINTGDTFLLAPVSHSKTYFGSGSSNAGDAAATLNVKSATKTNDKDIMDGGTTKAAVKS